MDKSNFVIWFISKYGATPNKGNYLRNFNFCKEFRKKNKITYFFNSYNQINLKPNKINTYFKHEIINDVENFQLNGPEITQGFSLKRIFSWFVFEFNLLRLTLFTTKIVRPDIIIVKSISLFSILSGLILKKRYNSKLIIEITDIWPLTLVEIGKYSSNNPFIILLGYIEKLGYNSADAIVGSMPNLKEHVENVVKRQKNVYYIPQGVDINNELSTNFNIGLPSNIEDSFSIIYAGTIGLANKIDDIINVARQLQLKAINVHIYILGNGPLKSFYIEEAKSLKNITFLDSISSQDVAQFLSNFDLLMLTWSDLPIYRFGVSPNKVIDYMKSGRPILMSYSGYPSLYELEKYCFLTEAENTEAITSKIIEIKSKSKIELDLMGKKAREILHKYHNYDTLSDKYIDIMNSF